MWLMNKMTVPGLMLILGVGAATASANEGAVRQASQNTQIQYRVGSELNWSVTGFPNDTIVMVRGNGTVIAAGTVNDVSGSWPCNFNWIQNSDGRITLRCTIPNPSADLNGGYVRVVGRNGATIDQDPFVRF